MKEATLYNKILMQRSRFTSVTEAWKLMGEIQSGSIISSTLSRKEM